MSKYNFKKLGVLQGIISSIVSVYVDRNNDKLYIVYKVAPRKYILAHVQKKDISDYVEDKVDLRQFFLNTDIVLFRNKENSNWIVGRTDFSAVKQYLKDGMFYDQELSEDEILLDILGIHRNEVSLVI